MNQSSDNFINGMCNASIYDHAVDNISVIETHISWVILTGDYAYKIKKPIKYSFVDFSTLEKREFYCNEELRLNRRLAPEIYLSVVAITGSIEHPSFEKSSKVIEYAVKMRQFSQSSLLNSLSDQNKLLQSHIDFMAKEIAEFHLKIDKVYENKELGTPEDIHFWVSDNYAQIKINLEDVECHKSLEMIQSWSEVEYGNKYDQFQLRKKNGFIRECHGDMHLGNMVLIENKITIFDGIDFNEHLRWIDVVSEVAFVMMDLSDRNHNEYAIRFINSYLQDTGDYEGLILLRYYLVYRAMVRAKVALLRIAQNGLSNTEQKTITKEFRSYLALASRYISDQKIALIITRGLSGSGKSTYTESLLGPLDAIRIRSDVERKRLYGYASSMNTQSKLNEGIYTPQSSKNTYMRLVELSRSILNSGFTVIVDACFLQFDVRQEFFELALALKVPFVILDFQASEKILKQRIIQRADNKSEPSEADLKVLSSQLNNLSPINKQEKVHTIVVNTEIKVHIGQISQVIKNKIEALSN